MSENTKTYDRDVDLKAASRGVWLVKVPKYISSRWEKAPGGIEVGKLKIMRNIPPHKAEVTLTLCESVLCMESDKEPIPKNHKLDIAPVTQQTLGVFSTPLPSDHDDGERKKIVLDGKIVQKLECRPTANDDYMKMKLETIRNAHKPNRLVQQLDRVVQNYKPVATHQFLKDYADKKKAEGKRARDDKNAVLEMLFKAFEKHQYYNIKDLVLITKQPVGYLKEILKEVCNHNMKNPHKYMWELKPEYRHYKEPEPVENKD